MHINYSLNHTHYWQNLYCLQTAKRILEILVNFICQINLNFSTQHKGANNENVMCISRCLQFCLVSQNSSNTRFAEMSIKVHKGNNTTHL